MNPREIYLDHNASSPLLAVARRAMLPYLGGAGGSLGVFGNPSSVHAAGRRARAALDHARARVAAAIGAEARELIFTSGGTEANVLALRGVAAARRGAPLVVGAAEHPCVLKTADALAADGADVRLVAVDREARISADALQQQLVGPAPALVSVQLANHELGTIQPIRILTELAHARGALMHVDAVAACCKIPLDVRALGVDLMSLSAHKVGGPVGVGALYVRAGLSLAPQLHGGSQEHGLRAGTESVALAVGFAAAVESNVRILARCAKQHQRLRRRLIAGLERHNIAFFVNSPSTDVLANTLNVAFPDGEREALLIQLDLGGIRVSAGAACASGSLEPSPVLLACNLEDERIRCALRVSFGPTTTGEHVDELVRALASSLARARTPRQNF